MVLDKNLIRPLWYIDYENLITILRVIRNLNEDLKRKIVSEITLINKKEEERQELIRDSYNLHTMMYNEFEHIDIEYYYSE